MRRACLFMQLYITIYTFLTNSILHMMLDMLVENHNLHLNISLRWMFVLWPFLCFVGRSQDKYTKQTASNCQALWVSKTPSVSAAYKPCLSVLQLPDCITTNTTSRSLSLTDEGITLNQSQRLHMKAFFPLHSDVQSVWFVLLLCMCVI